MGTLDVSSFKECITAFAKNLEMKSSTCEELQELFFKLANANRSLPENVDAETVDSFIAILVTVAAVNYGYPSALQALTVLFSYLKNDDKVFNQFRPTRDILAQFNFDKYLSTGEEGKELVLDFVCFMLRYYKEIEYADLSSDPKILAKIRKAELERTWMDIENLAVNQENIARATEQNQQTTSNAFAELYAHMEEIKKHVDVSIGELRYEIMGNAKMKGAHALGVDPSLLDPAAVKKMESDLNEKISELRKSLDAVMAESANLEARHEDMSKRVEDLGVTMESTNKSIQDIMSVINFETQLIKDARALILSRISKTESDFVSLANKSFVARTEPGGLKPETKEMANLRIDSIRNQIDAELLPKLNEIQVKLGSVDVMLLNVKQQQAKSEGGSEQAARALLAKFDERHMSSVSDLVKASVDGVSNEVRNCKKIIEATREQVIKLQDANEAAKQELRKEVEARISQAVTTLNSQFESINETLKQNSDKMRIFTVELDTTKRLVQEMLPQMKSVATQEEITEQRVKSLEERKLEERLAQTEERTAQMVEHLTPVEERLKRIEAGSVATTASPSRGPPEDPVVRDDFRKGLEQVKMQMQGYFDSCWTYIQQFADLHAVDKAREVKVPDGNYTAKLNCLDWLIRYHEYLSGKSSILVIDAFKEVIHPSKVHERSTYASAKHASDIMNQLLTSMRNIKKGTAPEEVRQSLTDAGTYMAILEITLVNDQNVETGISLGVIKDLAQFITFFRTNYDPKQSAGELKLTVRCLTYCFRNIKAIDSILDLPTGLTTVVALIQSSKDEEIVANSIKIVRVCLRSDKQYDKVVQKIPTLLGMMLQLLSTHSFSVIILEEATAAIRNYTRKVHVLDTIDDPGMLGPLCKLAAEKATSKHKEYSIGALRNCCKNALLLAYIKQSAAYEFVAKPSEEAAGGTQSATQSASDSRHHA